MARNKYLSLLIVFFLHLPAWASVEITDRGAPGGPGRCDGFIEVKVEGNAGHLDDVVRIRLGNQQIRAVDVKDGVRGTDQGGHIVGSRFFGPGEQINLYPQSANLNQGAWKQMENTWADAMVQGKDVKIQVEAVFEGTSLRPEALEVSYWIDGAKTQRIFINQ